ncbi:ATP-grasp domain-containing protein [Actinoplanes sp. CA-252034]|uniref:ATP-grasp domain-containing protein n=1 Tax=Actinoplanes sp. CA-252034 TaxID=3239906 RepID=UPI003D991927
MGHGSRVALVTCAAFPDLWEDDHPLRDALRDRGVAVDVVRWDDPEADWPAYDLTVIRSPWDYTDRPEAFVAWARSVPRLANPADIVAWNTDKKYLGDLAAAGIPIIPTEYIGPGESWTPPADGEWVVKPTVSAGSRDTARYLLPGQHAEAVAHVGRLTAAGRTAMIQPYLSAVDTDGETAVLCISDGAGELTFSHGIRKGAMLTVRGDVTVDLDSERITPRTPSPAELELAGRVLAAVPGGSKQLLYARVDLIPGPDGAPRLIELELTEPSLFLRHAPGAAERLADAIIARI